MEDIDGRYEDKAAFGLGSGKIMGMTRPDSPKAGSAARAPAPHLAKALAWRPPTVQLKPTAAPFATPTPIPATSATHVSRAIQRKAAPPGVVQRAAAAAATVAPSATIDWADFRAKAEEEGCHFQSNGLGDFLGAAGAAAYPHVHVWNNGKIALSWAHGKNTKIGDAGVIDIAALKFAAGRAGLAAGPLKTAIEWVLASAS